MVARHSRLAGFAELWLRTVIRQFQCVPKTYVSKINITLVFCSTHVTIHISLTRQASVANGSPDLHTCWQFYSSLNTHDNHVLFSPNTTMASIVMTVKYRLM